MQLTKRQQRRRNFVRFVKFTLFSASAGIVQALSFTLLRVLTSLPYWPKYLLALVLSVVYNFTLNRKFTFKSANNIPVAMAKVLGYYAVFTPLSTWWGSVLTKAGVLDFLVLAGTMVVNFVTEYLFWRFVVFGSSLNTNDLGRKENERLGRQSD